MPFLAILMVNAALPLVFCDCNWQPCPHTILRARAINWNWKQQQLFNQSYKVQIMPLSYLYGHTHTHTHTHTCMKGISRNQAHTTWFNKCDLLCYLVIEEISIKFQ